MLDAFILYGGSTNGTFLPNQPLWMTKLALLFNVSNSKIAMIFAI
jgi:hypothetical protein|tara:strand:+ start:265 stop:399 length:135 start_codon:yes stop_codon:yes gene_type:complete